MSTRSTARPHPAPLRSTDRRRTSHQTPPAMAARTASAMNGLAPAVTLSAIYGETLRLATCVGVGVPPDTHPESQDAMLPQLIR